MAIVPKVLTRFLRLVFLAAVALSALEASASGPIGHTIIASKAAALIRAGQLAAPLELREALKDPQGLRAYLGGAVGPDLEEPTHNGNTAAVAEHMLATAQADLAAAKRSKDPRRTKTAQEEVAFAYGWLTHSAADLNIHPVVNAATGDTYRQNNLQMKAKHGELEAAYTAYLGHGGVLPKYQPKILLSFLHRTLGTSMESLAAEAESLRSKANAEREYAYARGRVSGFDEDFKRAEAGTMRDIAAFTKSPKAFGNWDLDCGRISTAEFDRLREAAIQANGGKLPDNWGALYLQWHAKTRGLPPTDLVEALADLIAGKSRPQPGPGTTTVEKLPKTGAWVLERTELVLQKIDDDLNRRAQPKESAGDGYGTSEGRFGTPDPNVFVVVRMKCAWTPLPKVLLPGKGIELTLTTTDAGSDDAHGGYFGGVAGMGANCPSTGTVWYGPSASYDLHKGEKGNTAKKTFTPGTAAAGAEMVVGVEFGVFIRRATYQYIYKFRK